MRHLEEEEMGYFPHLKRAWGFAFFCFLCSFKAALHGIFPNICTDTSLEMEYKLEALAFNDDEK